MVYGVLGLASVPQHSVVYCQLRVRRSLFYLTRVLKPFLAMVMYSMTDLQYQAVYNVLSFSLVSMSATTMYLWFRASAVHDKYKSAVYISGLVTFIAAYHYIRIFNSWVDAHSYERIPQGEGPIDWRAIQRGVPLHGLAVEIAIAFD